MSKQEAPDSPPPARSNSYLIRFWQEPRERGKVREVWRGYMRDLRTGEEEYLSGPRQLLRLLTSRLELREAAAPVEDGERAAGVASE